VKAETLRPLADKSAFVAAQKRGRAVQLVCSAHRRRRTTCGSAVLLGRIASGGCWRGDAAMRRGACVVTTSDLIVR
jgi:hypothetical protein